MKKYILFFVLAFTSVIGKAQSGYTYSRFGVAFGASSVYPYADLKQANNSFAYNVNLEYNYTPYVAIALEGQMGNLSGGSIITDPSKRQYSNNYTAIILHADFQLGEVIEYGDSPFLNIVKNFYLGTGIGLLNNNVKAQRYALDNPNNSLYRFPGEDKSINSLIPLRVGYEFKIYNEYNEPNMRVFIGYVHNITFGEGLDGYTDPSSHFKNNSLDQYRQITVGMKFNFGEQDTYIKPVRPF